SSCFAFLAALRLRFSGLLSMSLALFACGERRSNINVLPFCHQKRPRGALYAIAEHRHRLVLRAVAQENIVGELLRDHLGGQTLAHPASHPQEVEESGIVLNW